MRFFLRFRCTSIRGVGSNELGRHPLSRVIEAVCGETRTYGVAGIQIISATLMDEWREVANC